MWSQSHCLYEPRKYVEGKALVSRLFVVCDALFLVEYFFFYMLECIYKMYLQKELLVWQRHKR